MFIPKLQILAAPQRKLWAELGATPGPFTLYGGTAIALRLGHRESVDFDFFSRNPFRPSELVDSVPYLAGGQVLQSAANTVTVRVDRSGPVMLSFFGGLRLGQVAENDTVDGPRFAVASLLDLAGMKVAVVTQRAELKDYLDIHALLTDGGIPLATMLSAASIIYGASFAPLVALKAISYHDDAALAALPTGIRRDLTASVRQVDLKRLPTLSAIRFRDAPP